VPVQDEGTRRWATSPWALDETADPEAFDQARDAGVVAVTSLLDDEDEGASDSGYDQIMLGMTVPRLPPLQRRPTSHE
jgi:hypothetical protein